MTDSPNDPLTDVLSMLGLPNPLSGVGRTIDQMRRGVDEMLTTLERFNETLDQLNGVARRVNGFLDDIEEPVKAAMPQVTRTVRAADVITQQLSAPVERLAPGLGRLAELLANPSLARLPGDLVSVTDSLGELVRRLQPLTQMAETAGSVFGRRALGGLFPRGNDAPASGPPAAAPTTDAPAPHTPAVTTPSAKKSPAKKSPAKKSPARKAAAKKAAAKKAATKPRATNPPTATD